MEQQPFEPAEAPITDRERRRRRRKEWWQRFIERRAASPATARTEHMSEPTIEHPRQPTGRRVLRLLGLGRPPKSPEGQPFLERGVVGHVCRATKAVLRLVIATEGQMRQEMTRQPPTAEIQLQPRLRTVEQQLRVQSNRLDSEINASRAVVSETRARMPQAPHTTKAPLLETIALPPPPEVSAATTVIAGMSLAGNALRQSAHTPRRETAPNWTLPLDIKTQQAALDRRRYSIEQAPLHVAAVVELASAQTSLTERTADILQDRRQQREAAEASSVENFTPTAMRQMAPEQVRKAVQHEVQTIISTTKEAPPAPTEQEIADRIERDPGRKWNAPAENNSVAAMSRVMSARDAQPARNPALGSSGQTTPQDDAPSSPTHSSFQHAIWWTIAGAVMVALGGFLLSMVR